MAIEHIMPKTMQEGYIPPKTWPRTARELLKRDYPRYMPTEHNGKQYLTDGWCIVEATPLEVSIHINNFGDNLNDLGTTMERIFREHEEDTHAVTIKCEPSHTVLLAGKWREDPAHPQYYCWENVYGVDFGLARRFYEYAKHKKLIVRSHESRFAAYDPKDGHIHAIFMGTRISDDTRSN